MSDLSNEFERIIGEMLALHRLKQADYGSDADPFSNVRSSEQFGMPGWLGAILRANDKMSRLKTFAIKGSLKNESVEDSLLDLANYAVIALVLWREKQLLKARAQILCESKSAESSGGLNSSSETRSENIMGIAHRPMLHIAEL